MYTGNYLCNHTDVYGILKKKRGNVNDKAKFRKKFSSADQNHTHHPDRRGTAYLLPYPADDTVHGPVLLPDRSGTDSAHTGGTHAVRDLRLCRKLCGESV